MALDPVMAKQLEKEDLRYISDETPGFFRQKYGKSFRYYDADGHRVSSERHQSRIEDLKIPPAWRSVWISPRANTHLQATGKDQRGRKQYIYHPDWIKISQENKFSKMIDFGLALPKIRGKVTYELRGGDLDKSKILATVLWLLDKTFVRIGNEEYTRDNNSYGLTTLRNKHAAVRGSEVTFRFRGKSGVENIIEIENPTIAKTVRQCIELPGYQLFQFIDDEGSRHVVDSSDVNEFLRDLTSDDFTAKDFRTWGATNISAKHLHDKGDAPDEKELRKNILEAERHTAHHLNNTVAVCRAYYIHPAVPESYQKNVLVKHFDSYRGKHDIDGLSWREGALIKLLEKVA